MPTKTSTGLSSRHEAHAAVREALGGALSRLEQKPAFGFLFASPEMSLADALQEAHRVAPGTDFLGCTTAGEITDQGVVHGGLAVMVVAPDGFQHAVELSTQANPQLAAAELSRGFFERRRARNTGVSTTVLLVDGMSGTGEDIVEGIRSEARTVLHEIVGGAAGDEGRFAATYVGVGTKVAAGAAAALHVTSPTRWGVGVDHGLTAVSAPMRVTRAEGNVLKEIDDKPAFEVYKAYAKKLGIELTPKNAGTFFINNELGVMIFDQLKKARAPLAANPDGSLTCAATVPQGASVCFLGGSRDDLVAAAKRAASEAKKRLGGAPAAGVLLFDCICRGSILGSDFQREIVAIREVFPTAPLAGFLTYGEIARYSGRLDGWHNTTAVVAAIPA